MGLLKGLIGMAVGGPMGAMYGLNSGGNGGALGGAMSMGDQIDDWKKRNKLGDLTLEDLKEQWEKQSGICPYTGINLILPSVTKEYTKINLASLDRIDSSKGYIEGNIQWVHKDVNWMKQDYSNDYFLNMCRTINDYQKH